MADRLSNYTEEEKRKIVQKVKQTALENELAITGCARSVVDALHKHLGLGNEEVIRGLAPFAGGTARTGKMCGAVVGGVTGIGLAFAPNTLRGALKEPAYTKSIDLAGMFCERFEEKSGALICREIQHAMFGRTWNFRDPKDREDFFKPETHDKCAEVAAEAAALAAEIILDNQD